MCNFGYVCNERMGQRVCEFAQAALNHPFEALSRPPDECVIENDLSYLSIKTNVMGTQKNRLNETVLLSTLKYMLEVMGKNIMTILHSIFFA